MFKSPLRLLPSFFFIWPRIAEKRELFPDIQRSFYNFQVDVSPLKVSFFPRKWSFDNFNHVFAFPNLHFIECLIVLLFSRQKIAVDSKTLIIFQYSSFYIILHQTTFSKIFYMNFILSILQVSYLKILKTISVELN